MGNLYFKLGNYKYALNTFKEIKKDFTNTEDEYNLQKTLISEVNVYFELKEYIKCKEILDSSISKIEKYNDRELLTFTLCLDAKINEALNFSSSARKKYKKAIKYGITNNQLRVVFTVIEYGNFLMINKDYETLNELKIETEKDDFQKLLEISTTEDKMRFYKLLYNYALITKDNKLNFYSDKAEKYNLILKNKYNLYQVKELQTRYKLQITEKEKINLEQLHEIEKKRLYIVLLSITIAFIFVAYLFQRNKTKSKLLLLNLEKQNIENKLKDIQIKQQKGKIKKQETDILAQTFKTIEANKEIKYLTLDIENNNPEKIKILQNEKISKKYWEKLIKKFETINPLFISTLIEKYPILTKGERDFCCLIKMNLSNKEIANLTQISPESVITKKYRIVKKLNLKKEIDFNQWLNTID